MRILLVLLTFLLASSATAQEVRDCMTLDRQNVVLNPLDMSGRSYANGEVTLAVIHDGRSNSTDSLFLLVYAPDGQNPDKKKCRMIGMGEGRGYANVRLEAAQADYTAADGLTVIVPARIYLQKEAFINTTLLSINVNRATDEITVTQELGIE